MTRSDSGPAGPRVDFLDVWGDGEPLVLLDGQEAGTIERTPFAALPWMWRRRGHVVCVGSRREMEDVLRRLLSHPEIAAHVV